MGVMLSVKDLVVNYGAINAIKGISFDVNEGEIVTLIGANGAGKSTTLNTIAGLLKPRSGSITFEGRDVLAFSKKEMASFRGSEVAMIFQNPMTCLNPVYTVGNQLIEALRAHDKKISKADAAKRAMEMLELVGINNVQKRMKQYPHELSVSTEQKVVIGRAFAMEPDLLLMDEPYGQMDIKLRFYLEDEVLRLWREIGTTVLFITHNIEEAVYLSERVLILSNKPATIKESLQNNLPYPRDISSPDFVEMRKHITDQIKWW